jgi:hypothetical protein
MLLTEELNKAARFTTIIFDGIPLHFDIDMCLIRCLMSAPKKGTHDILDKFTLNSARGKT